MKSGNLEYEPFFESTGTRALRHVPSGEVVARRLATVQDVERAEYEDRALRDAIKRFPIFTKVEPRRYWRTLRLAISQVYPSLRPAARYRIMRKVLGRLRDLKDPRQEELFR